MAATQLCVDDDGQLMGHVEDTETDGTVWLGYKGLQAHLIVSGRGHHGSHVF